MNRPGLFFEDVEIRRGDTRLLSISAHVPPGEVLTVMGPSGSGKSTLLALVTGVIDPGFTATGRTWLDGRDLTGVQPHLRRTGILFQDDALFPHLSVGGNLAFGLPAEVRGRAERQCKIDAALVDAGLAGMADRDPATLSGGQRARASLMRVMLSKPRALLLDEPFSSLDADLRTQFREFVFDHARREMLPVVLVTHDRADAEAAGGPVFDLSEALSSASGS